MKKIVLLICMALVGFGVTAQDNKTEKKREVKKVVINGEEKTVREYRINEKLGGDIRFFGIPDLTEEQKTKWKDLQTAFSKETRHTNNLINEKKARMKTLQDEDPMDQKSINSVIDELTALQGKLMKARVDHKIKVRAILTPEQRDAYDRFGGRAFMIQNSGRNFNMERFPAFGEAFQLKDFDTDFKVDFDGDVFTWKYEE